MLRISARAKGGKRRAVPIPSRTLARIDAYPEARARFADPRLKVLPHARLFVRWDGNSLSQQFVDALLRASPSTPA
jgi:site-specific recombinase XerD